MMTNILCGDDLHDRFTDLLSEAHSVRIATAWATGGAHLQALTDAALCRLRV